MTRKARHDRQRPSEFPDRHDALLAAARYNDAEVEEHGLEELVSRLGLDPTTLIHVSEQQAVMHALRMRGDTTASDASARGEYVTIELSDAELNEVDRIAAAILAGICMGWRARRLPGASCR